MTTGNPYEYDRNAPPLRSQATQRLMCRAWEEGEAFGRAEKAEIVSGLVEALQSYVISCGNTAYMAPRDGVQKAYALAKKAMAKAKGE